MSDTKLRFARRGVAVAAVGVLSLALAQRAHADNGWFSSLFGGGSNTTQPLSTLISQQQSVVAANIQQDASDCATGTKDGTIGKSINDALNVHTQLASATPSVENLFQMNSSCFTGLGQIFDLSSAIPSLSSIIGAAAGAVAQYAKQQVCTAVNQVTGMVTTPLNQAITNVNGTVGNSGINGMIGQGMSQIDPNLGAAYHSAAPSGTYTIGQAFSAAQTNFGGGSTSNVTTTTTTAPPTTAPSAQPSQQESVVDRLTGMFK